MLKAKKIFILLHLTACCISNAFAQQKSAGMNFFEGSWADLLKIAKAQNKMIFADVYTDWCIPCKEMEKYLFPMKEAGNKYNPLFINYKLNAEKGEGRQLAKKYNVSAFPTFLFLDSYGSLVKRVVGEKGLAEFNHLADEVAQINDKNTLADMETAFAKGNRDLAFLRAYSAKQKQLDIDNSTVLDEYFKALPVEQLNSENELVFMGQNIFGTQTGAFLYLMNNYDGLSSAAKSNIQANLYAQIVDRAAPIALSQKRLSEFRQLTAYADKLIGLTDKQQVYLERLKLLYFSQIRDNSQLKAAGYHWIERIKSISDKDIDEEDNKEYKKFITPFLAGQQDSTRHDDFKEVKAAMQKAYSKNIAYKYYYPASLFAALPDTDTEGLRDALAWAEKAVQLDPAQKAYTQMVSQLKTKLKLP